MGLFDGIASIFGSGVQAATIKAINNAQINAQQRFLDQQQQFTAQQQQQQNEFQRELTQGSYDQQLKMFNLQNAYNDPKEVAKRLRAAGYNPNLAVQGNAAGVAAASTPSAAMGSASSPAGSPSAPGVSLHPVFNQNPFGELAQNLKALADAKKAGVEASVVKPTADAQVAKANSETALNEFNLQLAKQFAPKRQAVEIDNLEAQTAQALANVETLSSQREVFREMVEKLKSEVNLNTEQADKVAAEAWRVWFDNIWAPRFNEAAVAVQHAQSRLNNEAAISESSKRDLNDALGRYHDALTSYQRVLNDYAGQQQEVQLKTAYQQMHKTRQEVVSLANENRFTPVRQELWKLHQESEIWSNYASPFRVFGSFSVGKSTLVKKPIPSIPRR